MKFEIKPSVETVEIVFIVFQLAQPLLPYALAFAAGAMVFVVVDDIIPESCSRYAAQTPVLFFTFLFLYVCLLVIYLFTSLLVYLLRNILCL